MPIYEYQCKSCGHKLEALQKFSDAPLTECPNCNQQELQKLISASGFQLKGTGWYATDYTNKGKPPKSEDTGGSDSKSSSDSSSGSSSSSSSSSNNNAAT